MTTTEQRITALEIAVGPKETDADARARALQEMPDDELERQIREIVAKYDDVGEDAPPIILQARKSLSNVDARRAWEKEQWGHLPLRQDAEKASQ
ncbi:MAG TPA: hypothetical protein VGK23_08685 [Methanomassiliicoccales archaeon]|jgi:hypothetical protein